MPTETRVVHCQKEPYDVYIGRPGPWGNPFRGNRTEVIRQYRDWIMHDVEAEHLRVALPTIEGKTLGCWCKPKACHGDVLVELVNANKMDSLLKF